MEICSGTDPEPEVLKLSCPYCQQTFETYDKIEKHIGIHIMRQIRNLHNLSQQLQQPGRVNWSHEHFSMTDFELPVHRHICHYCKPTLETNDKIEEHIFIKYYWKYTL